MRQWSDDPSRVVARRQMTKARWVERAEAERQERIAAMTSGEIARYEKWRAAHAPGSRDQRVAAKLLLAFSGADAQIVGEMSISQLEARIEELRADQRAWQAYHAIDQGLGVFG